MSLDLAHQRKVKVPRETFVHWVEEGIRYLRAQQTNSREIAKTFSKCGLDPYDDDKILFANHLESMSKCALYDSLTKNQESAHLDF